MLMRDLLRRARLRFWLWMMDLACVACGFGSEEYFWALKRASGATDWGDS